MLPRRNRQNWIRTRSATGFAGRVSAPSTQTPTPALRTSACAEQQSCARRTACGDLFGPAHPRHAQYARLRPKGVPVLSPWQPEAACDESGVYPMPDHVADRTASPLRDFGEVAHRDQVTRRRGSRPGASLARRISCGLRDRRGQFRRLLRKIECMRDRSRPRWHRRHGLRRSDLKYLSHRLMRVNHANEMRALVKARPEPGLWLQNEPVPEIGPDDVLVKVAKTGICGTDIHIWNWDEWARKTDPGADDRRPRIFRRDRRDRRRRARRCKVGQRVSGEGHVIGMRSRATPRRALPPRSGNQRHRRQHPRRLRRIS